MLFNRTLLLLILCNQFSGCVVGPDYMQPDAGLPNNFQNEAIRGSSQPGKIDFVEWWATFNDPQLTQYIQSALEQNLDLAQGQARVTQARAGLVTATAALLPSANFAAQASRGYQSLETPLGQILSSISDFDRYGNVYEANLEAGWELDVFGGTRRNREAALALYQASEAGVAATRISVAAQTADVYICIRRLQNRLIVAKQQVQTFEEVLSIVKLLHRKGLASEIQLRQTENSLAYVRASVPALELAVETAINALDVMLGSPPGTHRTELIQVKGIPDAPPAIPAGSPKNLLTRRPDLIIAERRLAASNAAIGAAVSEYFPKFSLNGLLGSATTANENLFTQDSSQAAGMLGLRWRLFDFGRINAQINQAKGKEAELLAAYRLTALRATADVENALVAMSTHEGRVNELRQGVISLERAKAASYAAYHQGVTSRLEVLYADADLLRAMDLQIQAQGYSAQARVAAFKALGGGWQPNKENI